MKPSDRKLADRVERAIAWVQRRLEQRFEWVVEVNREIEAFQMDRSGRDIEDPMCFIIEFNPEHVASVPLKELRSDVLHEILHAMTWRWWETVKEGRPFKEVVTLRRTVYEPVIYELERRIRPYLIG